MNKYDFTGVLPIFTKGGILVADKFTRIVHGGRGAYVEFDEEDLYLDKLHVPEAQKWRLESSYTPYYGWWETEDGIKVYHQIKKVDYADYKVGMWYISPVYLLDFEVVGKYDNTTHK